MNAIIRFLKDWMLPVAIVAGVLVCLLLHYAAPLTSAVEPRLSRTAKDIQPLLVGVMLFLQFNKISPKDLQFRRWHLWLILFQAGLFIVLALAATSMPHGEPRILLECAMLCFICPTAAAAGVITDKLGGKLSDTVTYVVLANVMAAVIIPLVIPIVHPMEGASFMTRFFSICKRVFPLLVFPLLAAWLIRYTWPGLHKKLCGIAGWAFYIWGITLWLSIYLATKALISSGISFWAAVLICLVSLACTAIQFWFGRKAGRLCCKEDDGESKMSDAITAGQALGQKNTGFLIWLGFSWMTPVTSVAGGLYSIWQNLFNSAELYHQRHH